MINVFSDLIGILQLITAIGYLFAIYFAIKLYNETDKGWYWLSLVLSAFFFSLSQWSLYLFPYSKIGLEVMVFIQEFSKLVAGIFFALSCYGIYTAMLEIRKRVE